MLRIDILSLFPEMFKGVFGESIIKRAKAANLLDIHLMNFRDFSFSKHKNVDDIPFGGGSGMVLKPEPLFRAVNFLKETTNFAKRRVILLSPEGKVFNQEKAKELATYDQLIFICGHYEGFDARISNYLADEAISIGDFVLTGGELPAMMITDAVARMIPGVLGSEESAPTDSFYNGLLEHPQYTRPRDFEGMQVPEVLFSGNHAKINRWRREEALRVTFEKRPDLLKNAELDKKDKEFLAGLMDSD